MLRRKSLLFVVVPVAVGLQAACTKPNTEGPAPATSAAATVASAVAPVDASSGQASATAALAATQRPPPRMPGPLGALFRAVRDLTLTAAQTGSIDKLEAPLSADDGPMKTDLASFHTDAAAGVRAGKVDTTKLQADAATVDKDIQARHDRELDAANGLHGVLDSAQRTALVASIRARMSAREDRMKRREVGDAGEAKADGGKGGEGDWSKRRLAHLSQSLGLDAAQQKAVGALLSKGDLSGAATAHAHGDEAKKHMDAFLAAFEKDSFDAKKVDSAGVDSKKGREAMNRHVQFLAGVAPLLKPEQREKLAIQLEHPSHGNVGGANGPRFPGNTGAGGHEMHADDHGLGFPYDEPHGHESQDDHDDGN